MSEHIHISIICILQSGKYAAAVVADVGSIDRRRSVAVAFAKLHSSNGTVVHSKVAFVKQSICAVAATDDVRNRTGPKAHRTAVVDHSEAPAKTSFNPLLPASRRTTPVATRKLTPQPNNQLTNICTSSDHHHQPGTKNCARSAFSV